MDSLLICAVFGLYALSALLSRRPAPASGAPASGARATCLLYLTMPGALITGIWLAWKLWYYGDLLPNTYYVKAADLSIAGVSAGADYVYGFFACYWLLPFFLVFLVYQKRIFAHRELVAMVVAINLWLLYVVKVGGDFMEFRFFVPILPMISLLLARLALAPADRRIRALDPLPDAA